MKKRPLHMLDLYLLRQLFPAFLIALSTLMTALLLERLLILLNDLASEGSSLATFIALLKDLLPHYLGLAIPAAFSISIFMTIRRMNDCNEIDALMAGGVSLSRISRAYILIGLVLGLGSLLLYGYIQPLARYDFRSGFYTAAHAAWSPRFQARMFASTADGAMLTAEETHANGSILENVFIRAVNAQGTVHLISAERGRITTRPAQQETRLDLWNGEVIELRHNDVTHPKRTQFAHSARVFLKSDHAESFRSRGHDARELTMFELVKKLEHSHQTIDPAQSKTVIQRSELRAELDFRLAQAFTVPFIAPLAVTLAISAKRRRPIAGMLILSAVLVGFYHILQFGKGFVASGSLQGLLGVWLPEIAFCLICILMMVTRSQGGWLRPRILNGGQNGHRIA